ncbi:MAG: hypothetical protein IKJ87_05440 [Ruminococcus sp.]|nr:hypothetical protein [Ruminococcus sp.]
MIGLISIIILAALIGVWYFLVFIVAAPPEKQEQDLIVPQNIECDIISKNNQEKRILKSKSYSKTEIEHMFITIDLICSIIILVVSILVGIIDRKMYEKEINDRYFKDVEYYFDIDSEFYAAEKAELLSQYNDWLTYSTITFLVGIVLIIIISSIVQTALNNMRKNKLKITDEHIIATGDKERTTILPYENIFSVSEGGIKGITLHTSIGKVTFHLIKNRNEIIKAVSRRIKFEKSGN